MNYLYCVSDGEMNSETGALAAVLTGWLGIPALTAATQHALLLAWAYGESLTDVRALLSGGKIPLRKTKATWLLTLKNLGQLSQILIKGPALRDEGLSYRDYLRLLLYQGSLTRQKLLALDLIQENIRENPGMDVAFPRGCEWTLLFPGEFCYNLSVALEPKKGSAGAEP